MPSTGGGLRKSGNLLWKEESDPEEDLDQDLQTGPAVLGQSAMGRTRKVPGGCVPSLVQRFNFGPLSHAQALVSEEVAVLEHRLGKTSSPDGPRSPWAAAQSRPQAEPWGGTAGRLWAAGPREWGEQSCLWP